MMYELFLLFPNTRPVFKIYIKLIYGNCANRYNINDEFVEIYIYKKDWLYEIRFLDNKFIIKNKEKTIQALEYIIMNKCKSYDKMFCIHAGCVGYKNKIFAFVGRSNSGKSTITAYLSLNDFTYISDDKIFLNTKYPRTTAMFRPIFLRHNSLDVLEKYNLYPEIKNYCFGSYERLIYTPTKIKKEIQDLPILIFIERVGEELMIREVTGSEKFYLLQENMIFTKDMMNIHSIASCLRNIKTYKIRYQKLDDIKNIMETGVSEL